MIDLASLKLVHGKMAGRVTYLMGAKARASQQTAEIQELDCSGYVRYLMQRCGEPDFPDGTWAQSRWLATSGWAPKLSGTGIVVTVDSTEEINTTDSTFTSGAYGVKASSGEVTVGTIAVS